MRREHTELAAQVNDLIEMGKAEPTRDELLAAACALAAQMDAHRHRATELLHATYMLDLFG